MIHYNAVPRSKLDRILHVSIYTISCYIKDVLFGILVEVPSDLLVEDLVSLVDVCDWLVAVVLGLSLLLAEASCQLKPTA